MPNPKPKTSNRKRKRNEEPAILMPDNIEKLPEEMLHHVGGFLKPKDLFQLAGVSKKMYQISWLVQERKYLGICREYNSLFLTAIKEFVKTHQYKDKAHQYKVGDPFDPSHLPLPPISDECIDACQYGDETYSKLIEKAADLNQQLHWIFHEKFLQPKEAAFFSEKDIGIYDELFIVLKHSVKIFMVEGRSLYPEDRQLFLQKLKNLIKEVAQLLIRWQCQRWRQNDPKFFRSEFAYAIHDIYELIGQVNDQIKKFVSIDYFDEKNRKQHLICLELQLSNFSKDDENQTTYGEGIGSGDDWTGDFNYTDLSGSKGLSSYLYNPIARDTCYFANFSYCSGIEEEVDALLCCRVKVDEMDVPELVVTSNNSPLDFKDNSVAMYKLGKASLLPKIKQLEEQVRILQQRNTFLENELKDSQPEEVLSEDTLVPGLK